MQRVKGLARSGMYYLEHIWNKMRYSHFLRLFFDGLAKLGIQIRPYYIVLEGLPEKNDRQVTKPGEEYTTGFLKPEDMKSISRFPGRNIPERDLRKRLEEGKKCFGVKYHGEWIAFTWINLTRFTSLGYNLSLKENEAYLFDAFTLMRFRGKGVAPFMRYRVYKELAKVGKERIYSYSEYFNTPAIRFKKKLNARFLELRLVIQIFGKWQRDVQVKKTIPYSNQFDQSHVQKGSG